MSDYIYGHTTLIFNAEHTQYLMQRTERSTVSCCASMLLLQAPLLTAVLFISTFVHDASDICISAAYTLPPLPAVSKPKQAQTQQSRRTSIALNQ
jgi:N-acyl-L-homoserine lactone synthetase